MKTKRFLFFCTLVFSSFLINAQTLDRQVISSTGQISTTDNLIISSTSGEVSTTSLDGDNLFITQGFQQANIEDIVDIIYLDNQSLDVSIYPNPVISTLNIDLQLDSKTTVIIELYDMQGKRLLSSKIDANNLDVNETIDMKNYLSGMYWLVLRNGDTKIIRTYKIQKI